LRSLWLTVSRSHLSMSFLNVLSGFHQFCVSTDSLWIFQGYSTVQLSRLSCYLLRDNFYILSCSLAFVNNFFSFFYFFFSLLLLRGRSL